MSLRDCIRGKAAQGLVDEAQARETADLYDQLEAEYARRMDPRTASRQAAKDAADAVRRATIEKKRQTLLQARAQQQLLADLESYRDTAGNVDLARAAKALFDRDEHARYSNIESRRRAVLGMMHSRMEGVLSTFRRDLLERTKSKAQLDNLVREIFGEDTGDVAARQFAEAWKETAEYARTRFNATGGRIPKRQDWGLPQKHDSVAVRKMGRDRWKAEIWPRLDRSKMIDEQTGLPMSDERLSLALDAVYENIATEGMASIRPSGAAAGRSLANRHADHRFLAFKSADDWLAYQRQFGSVNAFDVMVGHVESMARDIALMERLGPNPKATLRWLQQTLRQRGQARLLEEQSGALTSREAIAARVIEEDYAQYTAASQSPVHPTWARGFQGVRSLLTSAFLGAASLSAITDVGFQRMAARHAGLPQAGVIRRLGKMLRPTVTEDQRIAVRSGLIAENWSQLASSQARYVGEVAGPEVMRRISDSVLRVSGLSPWTQAGKWAFGMEFLATLAEKSARSFDELEAPLRRTMERYGINAGRWDAIRSTPQFEHEGATFLRPSEIEARTDLDERVRRDLATRVLEMITEETNFAVPSSTMRARTYLQFGTRPGTVPGELIRSFTMFKQFPATILMTHINRMANQQGLYRKGTYAAELAITTTLMGALALQMKEISKGRDPRPMGGDNAAPFWAAAMMQGGGLGIFGDFMFGGLNRFGRGLPETLAGPVAQFGNDIRKITLGNMAQLAEGEDTRAGAEAVDFLRRYTPGGSIWYMRAAWERQILDRLEELADPKAHRARLRLRRRFMRDFGQDYWWRPGERAPERAPDLGAALEAPQR